MDDDRARTLLNAKRADVQQSLASISTAKSQDREAEGETGDLQDSAQPLTAQGVDDAVAESLRAHLAAIDRAEARIADGSFGRSVRSGDVIPDERLEADPTAELTVVEARNPG
jgi:DnaK suppressor protein